MLAAGAASWWLSGGIASANAIAAYQPIGAASLASSYINLANPGTYNAAPGVAPTWDAVNGWKGDGVSTYLTTGIVPTGAGWSMIVRFSGYDGIDTESLLGRRNSLSNTRLFISVRSSDNTYANGGTLVAGALTTSGTVAVAGQSGYRNGAVEAGSIGAWSGAIGVYDIWLLGRNENNVLIQPTDSYIQALAIYNTTLTAPQVLAVNNAMMAL